MQPRIASPQKFMTWESIARGSLRGDVGDTRSFPFLVAGTFKTSAVQRQITLNVTAHSPSWNPTPTRTVGRDQMRQGEKHCEGFELGKVGSR